MTKINIVIDSDSDSEEEMITLPRNSSLDANMENNASQANDTRLSEENPSLHDIELNDGDITDVQSISQIPSSSHDSVTFQMPNPTEHRLNISFLCNPNDEEPNLRQSSISELFGDNLSSVQKRSWATDSTCE